MKQTVLPNWLQTNSCTPLPQYSGGWRRTDYLGKTLGQLERILAEDPQNANAPKGLLKKLDPHVKLCGAFILLVAAAITSKLLFLTVLNLVILGVALIEGFGFRGFAARVWLPAFIFSGLTVLPGTMSWVTPGESLYVVYAGLTLHFGFITLPETLYVTKQGVQSLLFVTLRSAASLGLMALLIKTTRWTIITKAFLRFGLPSALVAVLDMTYRYLYLFLLFLLEYIMGHKSRITGNEMYADKLSWIGRTIADFLRLTREYSEDIQHAMLARGFTGEYYKEKLTVNKKDACFLLAAALLSFLIV